MPELMPRLPLDEIGGAKVFRPCTINGAPRLRGDVLTSEDLVKVNASNLRALIDQRFIQPWRRDESVPAVAEPGEAMIVPRSGSNRFDVVVGKRLNASPLTRPEAEALAKRAAPRE